MLNKVTLIGHLGADPDTRILDNGTSVTRLSLATSESWKNKTTGEYESTTEWHSVICWRGASTYAHKHLRKGMLVFVEGKISQRKYTDKHGIDRYQTDIVSTNLLKLEKTTVDRMAGLTEPMTQQQQDKFIKDTEADTKPASQEDTDDAPF